MEGTGRGQGEEGSRTQQTFGLQGFREFCLLMTRPEPLEQGASIHPQLLMALSFSVS